ncbi:DUF397 domain-containing protein [Amycolatopsis australiensis]|uniref:DUF397 domain-containing protein n=1 Tax=Amycolatopsis australiensis TaxID=546364 RepID=UPI000931A5CD|nr:DUF397 domain-containing protein [Amycolatopsis australiensis]
MNDRCDTGWFTSSYSGEQGQCVEVRINRSVRIRDTQNRLGGELTAHSEAWRALLDQLRG